MALLVVIHVLICFFLIAVVLLQHGRGADIGASFGGSSQTLFGTEGPLPLLNKITTIAAICFMLTSASLAYFSGKGGKGSVMRGTVTAPVAPQTQEVPAPAGEQGAPASQEPVTIPMPTVRGDAGGESAPQSFPGEKAEEQEPAVPAPPAGEK